MFDDSHDRRTKFWQSHFDELPKERVKPKLSTEENPNLKLGQLPEGLKHAFLGAGDTFPVIISSKLDASQEQRLINMLRAHKSVLGWTITDIKGISPLICSRHIYLEEGDNPR